VLQFDPDSTFLLGGRWGAHYLAIFSIPSLHLLFSLSLLPLNNKSLTRHRSKIRSWFPPAAQIHLPHRPLPNILASRPIPPRPTINNRYVHAGPIGQ
jgi:hypothetical protein